MAAAAHRLVDLGRHPLTRASWSRTSSGSSRSSRPASSAEGIGPVSTPKVPRRKPGAGSHSTRCRTTSRAVHPSPGAGRSHASGGAASTVAVNPAATVLNRFEMSLIGVRDGANRRSSSSQAPSSPSSSLGGEWGHLWWSAKPAGGRSRNALTSRTRPSGATTMTSVPAANEVPSSSTISHASRARSWW